MTTIENLKAVLRYDANSGKLFWNPRPLSMFSSDRIGNTWNSNYANKEAGTIDRHGYIAINFCNKLMRAHRIIWAIVNGEWPKDDIDHINGNRSDNRIENLRAATRSQNNCNSKLRRDNKTGVKGITIQAGKYRAEITISGEKIHLGYFESLAEATDSRKSAEKAIHKEFSSKN